MKCSKIILAITLISAISFISGMKLNTKAQADCPGFGISWFTTYFGKLEEYAYSGSEYCLDTSSGNITINKKGSFNIFDPSCLTGGCGSSSSKSNVKDLICKSFSTFVSGGLTNQDKVIISPQAEITGPLTNYAGTNAIDVIYAKIGNGFKLKSYYNSLPADCKKALKVSTTELRRNK